MQKKRKDDQHPKDPSRYTECDAAVKQKNEVKNEALDHPVKRACLKCLSSVYRYGASRTG
jgi:hypothetical protein